MTTDPFTDAARAEAEALVDDIIRWDDTIATDGPCDGTWDSLAEYLTGRGWTRTHLAAQEPTDTEVDAAKAVLDSVEYADEPQSIRAALSAARAARRDEEGAP